MVFELQGTEHQRSLVQRALDRTTFPFERLLPQLRSEVGRERIPVEWQDLSRWGQKAGDPYSPPPAEIGHVEVAVGDHGDLGHEHAHGVAVRGRVLGLAWYSGKVTLDTSLEAEPELAAEVFLSEGAHMVDFFYMDGLQRVAVYNAFHLDNPEHQLKDHADVPDGQDMGHGHGWFDVGGYYSWVGEAFMGGFVRAYSDVQVTIDFDHRATPAAAGAIRQALTPAPPAPPAPPAEEPAVPPAAAPYFAAAGSKVFHDRHKGRRRDVEYSTYQAAIDSGRRPCGVCRPKP